MDQVFNFDANDEQLKVVFFETKRKYQVLRYQRPYAWGIDQVNDFWDDLFQNEQPYFLGSFIFNTEHEKEDGFLDIIDGQQRLLTITIMMAVIRDITKKIDMEYSNIIQRQDIAIEDWEGKSSFRLKPAESIESYFYQYIQNNSGEIQDSNPTTPEEKRIKNNYDYLKNKLQGEVDRFPTKTAKLDTIKRYRKKIRELMVINIEISHEQDAYDIFETTNARGMELTVGDLLKNLIFKNIKPGKDKDFAKEVWKEISNNIDEANIELKKFLRYFWLSKYDFVQEKKLYKEIKNNIADDDMQDFLQDLWDDSIKFNQLLEGDEGDFSNYGNHAKNIYQSVFALRLMGVSQCYVFLLSVLRNFCNLGFDPYKTFQLIEKFTFQYSVVCKLPGNRVEKIYSKYAIEIEKAVLNGPSEKTTGILNSIFAQFGNELKKELPTEGLFVENFLDISYKNSEDNRRLLKYILEKTNSYYKKTDEYIINFDAVNIEHLLPQSPDKEWHLSKAEIKEYVNKLGNLTLLSRKLNSKIQNSIPSKKISELKNSELAITQQLVELLISTNCLWNEEQITLRQKQLAILAFKEIWKI